MNWENTWQIITQEWEKESSFSVQNLEYALSQNSIHPVHALVQQLKRRRNHAIIAIVFLTTLFVYFYGQPYRMFVLTIGLSFLALYLLITIGLLSRIPLNWSADVPPLISLQACLRSVRLFLTLERLQSLLFLPVLATVLYLQYGLDWHAIGFSSQEITILLALFMLGTPLMAFYVHWANQRKFGFYSEQLKTNIAALQALQQT